MTQEQPEALRLASALDHSTSPWTGEKIVFAEAAAELRRLHAENEALRKDAGRYRWLRAQDNEDFEFSVVKNPHFDVFGTPEELDAAIDAAMKGQS